MKKELHKDKLSTVSGGESMPLVDELNAAFKANKSKEELEKIVLRHTFEKFMRSLSGVYACDFMSTYNTGIRFIESKFGPYDVKPPFNPPVGK